MASPLPQDIQPSGMMGGLSSNQLNEFKNHNALAIANVLQRHRPVVLSYNSCVLTNCPSKETDNHASVLIAQRWNKSHHRCEVKIRNSWGDTCVKKRKNVDCDHGQWWVGLDELAQNSSNITWIEKNERH